MHPRHLRVDIYEAFYSVAKDNITIVYLTTKKINWTSKAEDPRASLHSQEPSFIQSAFRNKLRNKIYISSLGHMEAIMGSVCDQE